MLRAYLQMLWPNAWTAVQQWHEKGRPYPEYLTDADGGNLPTVPQIVTYLLSVQPSSSQVDTLRLNP